jgi:hypothetical protein
LSTIKPSTFIVYQFTDTTLAFGFTSTDSAITVGAVDSKTFVIEKNKKNKL